MKKIEHTLENAIIVFLIIQPIFDLKIFYNSISTLIRTITIIVLFSIYFVKSTNKKKYWLLIYPVSLGIYGLFHHLNALNFNSVVPGNFNYSVIKECLYFIKMLVPFLLIYILVKTKINNSKLDKVIYTIVFIISLIIIITNIMGISYGSYSNEVIKANFFKWFNNSENYTYKDLASKGLFEYGNQISAVLLMFLPFVIKNFIIEKNIKNFIIAFFNTFALMLLATRVAVIGTIIVYVYTIFIIVFMKYIKKIENIQTKNIATVIILLLFYIIILPANPMFNRIDEMNNQYDDTIQVDSNSISSSEESDIDNVIQGEVQESTASKSDMTVSPDILIEKEKQIKYIQDNYKRKNIHEIFILNSYPYQYDTDFWIKILNLDIYKRTNYRYLEEQMVKRVIEINNNKYDKILGITHTRVQNIFNIEKDFIEQYYSLGIIGCILIFLPYFCIIGRYIYKSIRSKLYICSIDNLLSVITIFMMFGIAYNSGNLLNSLSFTIYFSLLYYKLYNTQKEEGGEEYVHKKRLFKFKKI